MSIKTSFQPPAGWGNRSQLAATIQELNDVRGNRDGLWNNENQTSGTHGNFFERQPLLAKLHSFGEVGLSSKDEVQALQQYRSTQEAKWGEPTTQVPLDQLKNGELFAAQKALMLDKIGRSPSEVTEGFIQASGRVDGQEIAPRKLFWQRFQPIGEPSGKVIVLSPGFQETGRNFVEQVQMMNKLGHDVIVMDHQWAGQSEGSPGGLDRGFGVARDVAAMTAHAQQVLEQTYGDKPDAEVVLFGNSMGGGPGVLGAMTLNDNDLIQLDGPPMPKGVKALLQAPYLGSTPNPTNELLEFASHLPLLNKIKAPSAGVPVLTSDKVGAQKGAQSAVLEDVRAQLRTMSAASDDLSRVQELIQNGNGPQGNLFVIHGDGDPLADPSLSRQLKQQLGDQVQLQIIDSDNHVLQQNPGEQNQAIQGLQQLIGE
jgi:alpha-beta hydrolase superfamily lysophospholipase